MILLLLRAEQRHGGLGRFEARLRAVGVEFRNAAGVVANLREMQRLMFIVDVGMGYDELSLSAAESEVVARDFGDEGHLGIGKISLFSLRAIARRGHLAAQVTEQIDLPGGVESDALALEVQPLRREAGELLLAAVIGAVQGDVGTQIIFRFAESRARRPDPSDGQFQVRTARDRTRFKLGELCVRKLEPPLRLGSGGAESCIGI